MESANKRIQSIDIVRGMVMVIMALDHVRDLMHTPSLTQSPTDLQTTTPALFFTRWITHLCAPTFVFLAGTSVYLALKKNGILPTRRFLLKRGLVLILIDLLLVTFLIYFDPGYHVILFEVIATIGLGFLILSLLIKTSATTIGAVGFLILLLHNAFPAIPFSESSVLKTTLTPLFGPAGFPLPGNRMFIMAYPPVPWLGIMLVGFAAGTFFNRPREKRRALFLKLGGIALLLFVALRFLNMYGDPVPLTPQSRSVFSFLSFMNVAKYPPSLLFCLATLGVMLLMLAFAEGLRGRLSAILMVYGKVPLFYFLAHFLLVHLLLLGLLLAQGFSWSQLDFASGTFGRPKGVASGLELGAVYLIWVAVVVAMYFPCVWYGRYKAGHPHGWVKYL